MHAHSAFVIGQDHLDKAEPCQDYALDSGEASKAYIIVSDGCSTGGKTDIGARFWAHAAKQALEQQGKGLLEDATACRTALWARVEPLLQPFEAKDGIATLVLAACDNEGARALVLGDGVVAVRFKDGRLQAWQVQYSHNNPYYPIYSRSAHGPENYRRENADATMMLTTWSLPPGQPAQCTTESFPADHPGVTLEWTAAEVDNMAALVVMSDGAGSLPLGFAEQLELLCSFKSTAGAFVQRRLSALTRQWKQQGGHPRDDLAMSAIWFGTTLAKGATNV